MDFIELLEKQRTLYINYLTESFDTCEGATEILLDQNIDEPEKLYRLYRVDCLKKDEEGNFSILEYNNDTYMDHAPISFKTNGTDIELNPIYWNGVEMEVSGFRGDWGEVEAWVHKWIDPEDIGDMKSDDLLSGLIHNFRRPNINGDVTTLAIDFGTAEVTAMTSLIEVLSQNGTSSIRIHSNTMI